MRYEENNLSHGQLPLLLSLTLLKGQESQFCFLLVMSLFGLIDFDAYTFGVSS